MTGDDESLELKLARQAHAEAEWIKKAAEQDRAAAEYERGQADRSLREIQVLEKSIAQREQALKQAGEPAFLARIAAADKALAEAKEVMKDYNATRHGAAKALVEINAREKAEREQSAA
jgi:hypothetical protein